MSLSHSRGAHNAPPWISVQKSLSFKLYTQIRLIILIFPFQRDEETKKVEEQESEELDLSRAYTENRMPFLAQRKISTRPPPAFDFQLIVPTTARFPPENVCIRLCPNPTPGSNTKTDVDAGPAGPDGLAHAGAGEGEKKKKDKTKVCSECSQANHSEQNTSTNARTMLEMTKS